MLRSLPFRVFIIVILCLFTALVCPLHAGSKTKPATMQYDSSFYGKMHWREIGPFRAGRSIAAVGVPSEPLTYYFGATGGGIWKTENGGESWLNVSDGYLKVGIVGALAVAESDPNVIYAGTGESCIRSNAMPGEGIYKSCDAGRSWQYAGLAEAQTIGKIRVNPRDGNLVYAAVFGHVFGNNPERGVYRSKDGGKTWDKVLYKDDRTGAVDLSIDPNNPRIIYAAMWEAFRNPWTFSSGGPGSGLYKSTDGGDTWNNISAAKGLPEGILGKIGIAASPTKPGRVWAIIEAEKGGLFRSEDWGKNWTKVNEDRRIRQRAWYFSHIFADTKNPDLLYLLNVGFMKSSDGGKTLTNMRSPHSDNHDLWIDPQDPRRMITADDGGASVSVNAGQTWTEENVATAQFYHVTVDSQFPYHVYGAQQDNSTIGIASRTMGFGIDRTDWTDVGGGESGYIAVDWKDPDIVYAGSYDGFLTKYDNRTKEQQDVSVWPDNPMGAGAEGAKYRFQWTYPIIVSKYDPNTLYVTANVVFKSTNEGMSWEKLSGDLTRNDTSKFHSAGGPLTKDNTSAEYYGTIFAFSESPIDKNVLWAGSDDGLIHVSQDGGLTWQNVTPGDLPEWSLISIIDPSPYNPGTAYMAANRYKMDDCKPYMYKTTDFGKSWNKIVNGIPEKEFTHVVRADPNRKGLLYAGTERGIYVSFNDGEDWQPLQINLPVVPVHDIAVQAKEKDLVIATHGRAFWILDDLTPLYQLNDAVVNSKVFLFKPRDTYRTSGFSFDRPGLAIGKNPPSGVMVYYYFATKPKAVDSVKLEFYDDRDSLIKSFKGEATSADESSRDEDEDGGHDPKAPADSGMNRFEWNMHYADGVDIPGAVMWGGTTEGPRAIPGKYQVKLKVGTSVYAQWFEIKKDPRLNVTQDDFKEQFALLMKIRDKVTEANETVNSIQSVKSQTGELIKRITQDSVKNVLSDSSKKLNERLGKIANDLYQSKAKAGEDLLNYPIKLNNKIAGLVDVVASTDARPTQQSYDVFKELSGKLDDEMAKYQKIIDIDLANFNALVKQLQIPAVILKNKPKEPPAPVTNP